MQAIKVSKVAKVPDLPLDRQPPDVQRTEQQDDPAESGQKLSSERLLCGERERHHVDQRLDDSRVLRHTEPVTHPLTGALPRASHESFTDAQPGSGTPTESGSGSGAGALADTDEDYGTDSSADASSGLLYWHQRGLDAHA